MSIATAISPENTIIDEEHPWPGLESFTEKDFKYFHGRYEEINDLFRFVKRDTLTVLFGTSGLGKTSLLKAGLFPKLIEADFLPILVRLTHSDAPEPLAGQVRLTLEAVIDAQAADAPKPRDGETLWSYFYRKDVDFWGPKNRLLIPVLVFDQFEEIFTLGRESDARRTRAKDFIKELADLAERRPPTALKQKWESGEEEVTNFSFERERCKIILSLREDYLPDLESFRPFMRSVMRNRLRIRRMNGQNAFKVVVEPAPGLVDDEVAKHTVQLVAQSRASAPDGELSEDELKELEVEPALLSLVCSELNTRRIANKQPKITTDLLRDNYHDILKRFYNESLADLAPEVRFFIEDRLLTRSGYRTSVAIEDALAEKAMTQEIIDRLVTRRLLRIEDRFGVLSVELTHDILTAVIRESRDTRQKQAADAALAVERERAERERREAAEALAAEQTRSKRERMRTRLALVGLFIAVISLGFAVWFGVAAKKAEKRAQGIQDEVVARTARIFSDLRDKLQSIDRLDLMRGVTDDTIKYLEGFRRSGVTDAMLYTKGVALETRGDVFLYQTGEVGNALKAYTDSLATFRSLTKRAPVELDYRFAVSIECFKVADAKWVQADLKGAMESYNEAVDILQQLVKEKDPQRFWSVLAYARGRLADGLKAQGKLDDALTLYEQSLQETRKRAPNRANDEEQGKKAEKDNEDDKEELAASYVSIGDALRASGELSKALKYQQDGLDLRKQLAEADPSSVYRKHSLSQSYDRVGEALQALGQFEKAVEAFSQSFEIFKRLTEQDPNNAKWRRNYSVTLVRLTNILAVMGDTATAGTYDPKILEYREILASVDERNADVKDDLSEACVRVGDSSLLHGNLKETAQHYKKAFKLRSETAKKDFTNLDRQELLAESHEKMGEILFAQGSLDGALQDYEESRGIRQRLVDNDRSNTLRKSAVATSNEKLGDTQRDRGEIVSALERFQQAVTVRKALAEKDPSNLQWQADLAAAYRKLAEIEVAQKNLDIAFDHFRQSLDILEKLTQLAPKNSDWQASLCDTRTAFADGLRASGKGAGAIEAFRPVLDMREGLAKLDETNVKRQSELAHALYLAASMAPPTVKSNATAPATLKRAKGMMQSLKEKAELTAEQKKWAKEIEQAK